MVTYKRDYKKENEIWKGASPAQKEKAFSMTQNFTMIDGKAYSTSTGEDITDRIHTEAVISAPQRQGAHIKQALREHEEENGGYVFAFFNVMHELNERFPTLTQSDLARLMFIGTYISYNEGESKHCYLRHAGNGVAINKKSLAELVGMSRNKYSEFYKRLIDNDVIKELSEGIAVNPTIFYRGENLESVKENYQYTRLFRKTARELYEKFNGQTIKKLGVIYAILPYVNFNYNIVCNNPQQVVNGKIDTMKLSDLANRLNYENYRNLLKTMREIRYNDQPVFKFVDEGKDRRNSYIIVNPNVIYAGNGKHLGAIKILFDM